MFTWFINTKKIARARSRSTPSRRVQLRVGFPDGAESMFSVCTKLGLINASEVPQKRSRVITSPRQSGGANEHADL